MMRRLTAAICLATTVTSVAHAEDSPDERRAKIIWRDGVKQYDLGDFDGAIKKFEEAYKISSFPNILFNLGQAHRQLKNYERSVFYFRAYLRNTPSAANRQIVEDLIAELEKIIATQKASNEKPPDEVNQPVPSPVPAATTPPAPTSPADDGPWYQDPIAWTLAGAGVVALGLGTGFLIHSSGLSSDAKATGDEQDAQNLHDSAKTFQIAGGITVALGVGLVAGGVVKMVLHSRHSNDSKVDVAFGPSGFAVFGRF